MRIGLITNDPNHPLLAETSALLKAEGHEVEHLPPSTTQPPTTPADVYLLKARSPEAIALARRLEHLGIPILNSPTATEFCQDRTHMALLADQAHLPFAPTIALPTLSAFDGHIEAPLVIKSRHSRRGDLVARVSNTTELEALRQHWPDEPVVIQDFTPGTGWDHKLWVVADQVFAALRRSEFTPGPPTIDRPAPDPHPWAALALSVGEVFGLDIYGVDILEINGHPQIIDINAFPGMRGRPTAPQALATRTLNPTPARQLTYR